VTFPSERWEGDAAGEAYWNEGAWVLERRGVLHQMYSGGFYREPTYGIGTASAPHARGPWTKDPANPIFRSGRRITGPGHHCVVLAPDGVTPYVVYHAYDGARPGRKVHLDRLFWCGDRPAIAGGVPTEEPQPLPPRVARAHLDDDALHALPHAVAWAPGGPLELSVAVRGEARLRAGAVEAHARSSDGRFALLRAWVPEGADEIRLDGSGEVTDLVVTAR
jgi:hypothetical protein